jgi:glycosyltransferase involved in cell wall biosynthesis
MKLGFVSLAHLRDWTGITRLIDRIAAEMVNRKHEVVIIAKTPENVSGKIPVSALEYPHELITGTFDGTDEINRIRTEIADSGMDVCMASIGNADFNLMPRLFGKSGIPFIAGDPADPRVFIYERWNPFEHFGVLSAAGAVQVLLEEYVPFYPDALKPKITVIGNPVPEAADIDFNERRERETRCIIGAGRFNEADKRFSLLLRAFALIYKDFPDWRLKLMGDGPYMEYYRIMAQQLGISRYVVFTGAVSDTGAHYAGADIFCLPSYRAEGLPMTFLEASSFALPLVGFASCAASKALIEPDMGALCENFSYSDLAEGLRGLMSVSPAEREKIGLRARERLYEKYNEKSVFDKWEKLLMETANAYGDFGKEWDGLTPDSKVWTNELLQNIADSLTEPDSEGENGESKNDNVEIVRLRCELAAAKRDYGELEKKYTALLNQFQAKANQKNQKNKKRR